MKNFNKKLLSFAIVLCMFLSCFSGVVFAKDTETIVILYENDVHCAVEGYSKLAAMKNELSEDYEYVGVVSSGDFVQGGTLGAVSRGEYVVSLMNLVGYDAVTLGNHEFDYKLARLNELVEWMNTKPISCNFQKIGENKSYFEPYSIVSYGDVDIAYIGITTPSALSSSSPAQFKDENGEYIYTFNVDTLYDVVQANIDSAKEDGADYIIALSHIGYEEDPQYEDARDLIENTDGFDVVLDGHSHSVIENMKLTDEGGNEVVLTSTGTKFENIGKLTISGETIATELIETESYTNTDASVDAKLAEINEAYSALGNRKIGESEIELITNDADGNRLVRTTETNLGNLCADAIKTVTKADIAYVNGGGIRAPIEIGEVSFNDIFSVFPFNNQIVVAEMTGQKIRDMLEMSLMNYPAEDGSFPHVAGLTFSVNKSIPTSVKTDENTVFTGVDGEYRVYDIKVLNENTGEYEPIKLDGTYSFASFNYFVLDQGGGMSMFDGVKILKNDGMLDVEALETYITENLGGVIGEEYAEVDNRITFTNIEVSDIDVNIDWDKVPKLNNGAVPPEPIDSRDSDINGYMSVDCEGLDYYQYGWATYDEETEKWVYAHLMGDEYRINNEDRYALVFAAVLKPTHLFADEIAITGFGDAERMPGGISFIVGYTLEIGTLDEVNTKVHSHTAGGDAPWDGTSGIVYENNEAYIYLTGDVALSDTLTVESGNTLNLCLNGNILSYEGTKNSSVIYVEENATLNIYDCKNTVHNGYIDDETHLWRSGDAPGGAESLNLIGGVITGGTGKTHTNLNNNGGGIFSSGNLSLYGGTIAGNTGVYGGGIFIDEGSFNMYGGSIIGNAANTSYSGGGGVDVEDGTFYMHDGIVAHNYSAYVGGGVVVDDEFYMLGGSVVNNTAKFGSGIKCDGMLGGYGNGKMYLSGTPVIKDNTATSQGSGNIDGIPYVNGPLKDGAFINLNVDCYGTVAAPSGDVESIADYTGYFENNTQYPMYVDEYGYLELGYTITEQPSFENGYTVSLNENCGETYQWYEVNEVVYSFPKNIMVDQKQIYFFRNELNASDDAYIAVPGISDEENGSFVYAVVAFLEEGIFKITPTGDSSGVEYNLFECDPVEFTPTEEPLVSVSENTWSVDENTLYFVIASAERSISDMPEVTMSFDTYTLGSAVADATANSLTGAENGKLYRLVVDLGIEYVTHLQSNTVQYYSSREVTFNAGEGTGTMDVQKIPEGVETALNKNTFTRSGYKFAGWATDSDGYVVYEDGANVTLNDDLTLFAKWTKIHSSSGGGVTHYTVKFDTNGGSVITNKTVTRNSKLAEPQAPTREGYSFIGWFTDKEMTDAYDFESKVTKNFTLYAKWEKHDDEIVTAEWKNPFTDVKENDWFYNNIKFVSENGLMKGVTDTTFAPNENLTRAMLVTVLYRAEGELATNRSIPFSDIDMGAYYANAVSWANQNGIVNGVSENEFAPDESITREQIAAIMMRYAVYKGMDALTLEENLHFADADEISEYAVSSMNWAVGAELINGKSESLLAPKDNATRAEVAAILHRYLNMVTSHN